MSNLKFPAVLAGVFVLLVSCAFAQVGPVQSNVSLSSDNPCFVLSDQETFEKAEKEVVGEPIAFASSQGRKVPSISSASSMNNGVANWGVFFDKAVDYPDLVPGFLVLVTFTFAGDQKVTRYLSTKAALNTFTKPDGKKRLSPYFYFVDMGVPTSTEVTVLTMAKDRKRSKYVGSVI